MAIRERPKKNKKGKVFEVYFTYKDVWGKTRRYSKSGFATKKEAKIHEALKRVECEKEGEIVSNHKKTFNEVFEEYMVIEGANKYAPSTKNYYLNTYELYVKNTPLGNKDIFKIRYKELQLFFNELDGLGIPTIKNIKKIFNVTFKFAVRMSYIPNDPMLLVRIKTEEPTSKTMEISEEEFREICRKVFYLSNHSPDYEAQIWNNFVFYLALQIGWYLGLRISEALALKKSDFDLEAGTVSIQRRLEYQRLTKEEMYLTERMKTKGSKAILPVAEPVIEVIKLWFRENPYDLVICDIDGKLIHPSTINFRFRKIAKEMGINFHFHLLRHSLSSRLARNNIHPASAKELMRHSLVSTTLQSYTHVNEQDKRNAINKLIQNEKNA